jgi:hypothetical protein
VNRKTTKRSRWGLLPVAILFLLALAPQVALRFGHRPPWTGSYFSFNPDEAPYLAYINALKNGRPRRSDPFSGRDDRADAPQPESIFSIQFVPAYVIALSARVSGVSSQTVFAILSCLVAICAALGIYILIRLVTGDGREAAAGALIVLCCGSLRFAPFVTRFSSSGRAQYFPFLRSYVPSFAFPLFILFLILVWVSTTTDDSRRQFVLGLSAAAIFLLLMFSYFYLWTAAIAWLCILAGFWLVLRPDKFRQGLRGIAIIVGVAVVGLFSYWRLLAHRATSTDEFQVVTKTHWPDLIRLPELIGLVVATAILYFARRGTFGLREQRTVFILSLALLPLAVFNQQVLTGYSIQPIHYELYVANYVALLAAVLMVSNTAPKALPGPLATRAFVLAAIFAIGWGAIEITYAIRARSELNVIRDEARPAALRLAEMAKTRAGDPRDSIVFATNIVQADTLPADAPQPVLWAPHMRSFPGVDFAEDKSRYYTQLYYTGVDAAKFESLLRETTITPSVVFGWERVNARLASEPNPISEGEIQQEVRKYADYIATFDHARAASVPLEFAVASRKDNLSNLDRWYVRDEGEPVGNLLLYRLRLR